jgi:potassium efflux system protein
LRELGRDVQGQPYGFLLALLFWLILLFFQPRLRSSVVRVGEKASSGSCRSYLPTISAMAWTLAITVFWPSLMLIVAWLLSGVIGEAGLAAAVSAGLVAAGLYYLALEFLRQICRREGLADAHFGWPEGVRLALRRNLRWLLAATVGLVFAAAMLYADAGGRSQDTVEISQAEESAARLFILITLVSAALFVHVILRRKGLFCMSLAEEAPHMLLYRWRRSLHTLLMLVLLTLFLLAFVGYDYTVSHLGWQLFQSTLLLEILLVIAAMVNRWLVIVRRRMAIEQAQQRRAQLAGQSDTSGPLASITVKEHVADLEAIGEQSRRLVRASLVIVGLVGLWLIWNDVIPALSILERFELYTVTAGAVPTKITANHLVMAVVILVATVLATRNIPGLLEIAILSRLPLDAGNRYAIITVSRYVLAIVGLILVFGSIGIPWSSYQWLVAGITVGLGFGLQEIFANFVSGLIVLFEQPIRVGDVVTIGDVTGVVSRIRMRATTVTNWEHQELIVPNREFITGRLLNWTLSSTVNRVVISVGVAYGTDPDLVRQILLDIAHDHPSVLEDPAPNVTFSEFGESTLNIVLRCYLPSLDDRLAVIHQLNTTAQKRLNEAGVTFAFPTRELYIRTPEPFDRPRTQVDDGSA